jgi:hypothetical protein
MNHSQTSIYDPRASFPEIKRRGHDVIHWPPSSTEVKKEWSYTSNPPTLLRGVDSDKFTFTFLSKDLCLF